MTDKPFALNRPVVQILDFGGILHAVCADGSVWKLLLDTWKRLPGIPG